MGLQFAKSLLCVVLAFAVHNRCWADGGALRAVVRSGDLQVYTFTSPQPPLAGPIDVSVLVQDAAGAPQADAIVDVRITPRGHPAAGVSLPATERAATNKLFRACVVELEAGTYDVTVACVAGSRRATARFPLEVGARSTGAMVLWPWFVWPAAPAALFGIHLFLARRAPRQHRAGRLQ